jgi:hypothetical protein
MDYSMSLNNFKKVAAVATFLSTLACLTPDSAEAITLLRFSGSSFNGSQISFNINTSVSKSILGYFPNAIEEFKFNFNIGEGVKAEFKFGNLTASLENGCANKYGFAEDDCVKYEVAFDTNPNNVQLYEFNQEPNNLPPEDFRLFLHIPTTNEDSLDSLLTELPQPIVVEVGYSDEPEQFLQITFQEGSCLDEGDPVGPCTIETINAEAVPEPSETTSLLGAGAIGGILLLKRSRRSRKLASSKLTLSE